jgi:hypothetical protein
LTPAEAHCQNGAIEQLVRFATVYQYMVQLTPFCHGVGTLYTAEILNFTILPCAAVPSRIADVAEGG